MLAVANIGSEIIGSSWAAVEMRKTAMEIARTEATTLLLGETGTGKDFFAHYTHNVWGRGKPFVKVNCSNLPKELFECELFGYERGAFSGAVKDKVGLVEAARDGTLCLADVDTIPLGDQAKLLGFLEEGQFRRIGSTKEIRANARVIASSNRDLSRAVSEGCFRSDLYYRLNVIDYYIPPLRERPEDILELASHFLKQRGIFKRLTSSAGEALIQYPWPGNVRQLANTITRAVALSYTSPEIEVSHLGLEAKPEPLAKSEDTGELSTYEEHRRRTDSLYFRKVFAKTGGNTHRAAAIAGLSSKSVYAQLQKLGLRDLSNRRGYG